MDYYSPFWGPESISIVIQPQRALTCQSSKIAVLADSGPFQSITDRFGVPECFPRLTNLGVRLRVGRQHSWFLSILDRFVDYYSHFWGPKAISMIVEPYGALTCRSSTIAVLADSGPFRALLLTVLES